VSLDDPASVDVEATVEDVGATPRPDDVVDHERQEQEWSRQSRSE
jgi:hypothetical protein